MLDFEPEKTYIENEPMGLSERGNLRGIVYCGCDLRENNS
jgi:hypothetical protein